MNESFTTDDQLLVTPEEAARRLSVGRTTIYELMASGELQSVNIGRCRRVPVSSLSLFVNRLIGDAVVERPRSAIERRASETAWEYAHEAPHMQPGAPAERVEEVIADAETSALRALPSISVAQLDRTAQ
jgi:excisionase family DNA binding protein